MGDAQMGLQARLMSQAMRKLTGIISKSKATVIFINQIRMKIGVMFGNPETTTGGNALKFYASVRMDIRRIGQIKEGENISGNRTKKLRLLKIRLRHHLERLSSILCIMKGLVRLVTFLIWRFRKVSWIKQGLLEV